MQVILMQEQIKFSIKIPSSFYHPYHLAALRGSTDSPHNGHGEETSRAELGLWAADVNRGLQ